MSAEFDPYHKWLGIPPKLQPPNHYRLLGVELFESDLDVIEAAANQRMAYLQGLASGEHGELSQTLLNELALARVCLMDPDDKDVYDAELKHEIESSEGIAKQTEARTQAANTEATGTRGEDQSEAPPAADGPTPPPVSAAPPVAVPEPDAAPPAKPKPPPAPPAPRAGDAGKAVASQPPDKEPPPPKQPPPVQAKSTPLGVVPVVSVPTDRPTSHARRLRGKRGNPALLAAGSVAAVVTLLAVIYFATGQWKGDRATGSGVSQSDSQSGRRRNDRRTPEQPGAKTSLDGEATGGTFMGSTGRQESTDDEFLAGNPVVDLPVAEPTSPNERASLDETPFAEAMLALTDGKIEQALPLLERVLESPDSQRRTWARQMLEEVDIATSDYAARELLDEQLSDEQLELFVAGKSEVGADNRFSYPALGERFRQTLRENAPAVLERRRANQAEVMAAAPERSTGDEPPREEHPPAKPKKTEAEPPSDPAEYLESRGLRKQEEFWLLEGDDELRENVAQVDGLARSSRAADTAVLKEVNTIREAANQLAKAKQGVRIGIIEEAHRGLDGAKREYREVLAKSMKSRSQLTVASLQAARRAEKSMAEYQELADDPNVRKALERLGPETNQLGPTPALERNLKRIQTNDKRLLTDQVMGFYGGEEEDVFHVEVILNDRATALFALRPQAEFSLVPEHVLREAGIPYDAKWKIERKANGIEFRTNPVVIPSLRLGKFVSTDIEAFILPADVRNLRGILANNAFPNFRIDVQPGENVARLRAVR